MVDGWEKTKLAHLCNKIKSGGTPKSTNKEYYSGEIPFVIIEDMTHSKRYLKDTMKHISDKALLSSNTWKIPPNNLLYSIYATLGEVVINKIEVTTNQAILGIIPNSKKIVTNFLYYILESHKAQIYKHTTQTTQKNLNLEIVQNFEFTIPKSVQEQSKIAEIFWKIDKTIDQTEKIIAKHERIKEGLMQDLFTKGIDEHGNIRSEEIHKFRDSPFGRIPEEWDIKELKDVGKVLVSNVDKKIIQGEMKVKLCNYMDVYTNEYIDSTLNFMEASATPAEINKFTLEVGDVIFTKDSETPDDIAVPSVVTEKIDNLICGYHLAIVRPNQKIINGLFLMKTLKLKSVNNHFSIMASGSTRFGLTLNTILTARIPVPKSKNEQEKIENILWKIDQNLSEEKQKLTKLKRIKAGLMQDLLTGKVRVTHLLEQEVAV